MKNIILVFLLFLSNAYLFGQCETEYNHPEGRDSALYLTIYQDFLKAKEYQEALPKWTQLYECCPAAFKGKILSDGDKIYRGLFKTTDDEAEKAIYARKRIEIIEKNIECYGFIRKLRKTGRYYAGYWHYIIAKIYMNDLKEYENANKHYEKSIKLDSTNIEDSVIRNYAYNTVQLYKIKKITLEKYRAVYKILIWIAEQKEWTPKQIEENIDKLFSQVDELPYDCDYAVKRIRVDYEAHKNDRDYLIEKIFRRLRAVKCEASHPFVEEVSERVNFLRDSLLGDPFPYREVYKGHRLLRENKIAEAKIQYAKAIKYYEIPSEERFVAAMRLAKLYQKDKEWQKASETFEFAITLNENSGEPYISIGMLYLLANRTCENFERQLVANIAINYFKKAIDFRDTKEEAQEKITTYSTYLPTKQQIADRNIKEETEREVGCILKKKTVIYTKP